MQNRNVVSEVVKNDLCIGCGVCAGVCPSKNLVMGWNEFGEYNPQEKGTCIENCSLCLEVCPFAKGNDNEGVLGERLFGAVPGIQHKEETGYYLSCLAGFSRNRDIGASGGIASFLLEELLDKGLVDKVISVAPTGDPEALFKFKVMDDPEGVRQTAGSAYYPAHLSDVIGYIKENPGIYAVTALPCFAKGLRLAAEKQPLLKQRIRFVLGLVCGQLKSSFYTRYIASLAGVDGPLKHCFYRKKDTNQPANNFTFTCEGVSGKTGSIRWNEGVAQVWTSRWFTPLACNFCDDVFAELADATFMDAWLPQYAQDPKGTGLVLVRNPEIRSLLEETIGEGTSLEHISIEDIIRSQAGVVAIKRKHLAYRLHKAMAQKKELPKKRVAPSGLLFAPFRRKEIDILDRMQNASRNSVLEFDGGSISIKDIQGNLEQVLISLKQVRRIMKLSRLPFRIARKIYRIIRGTR